MLRTHAQSVFADHFGDFCHRAGCFETEIADDDERFVHQNARTLFQLRQRYARIDIAIIIGAADHDVRCLLRSGAKKRADPVRRRSDFLDHFLELLNHPPRFDDRLLLIEHLRTQLQQFAPNWIARRQ